MWWLEKEVIEVPAELLTKNEPASHSVAPDETDVPSAQAPPHRLPGVLANPQVRVGLLAAVALLVEWVLASTVLDVELDFFAVLAPFFIFTAYKVSGQRGRTAEIVASLGVVVAAATVVLVYAL